MIKMGFSALLATVGLLAFADTTTTNPKVTVTGGNIAVTNQVSIANFPSPQPVVVSGTASVSVTALPPVQVTGVSSITGSVGIADISSIGSITTNCTTPSSSCPAGSFVSLTINGVAACRFQTSGSFTSATFNVDGSADNGSSWSALGVASGFSSDPSSIYSNASITSSAGAKYRIYRIAGLNQLRVRASGLGSGSMTVNMTASIGSDLTESVQLMQDNFNNRGYTGGLTAVTTVVHSYSSGTLLTGSYTTLIASTPQTINDIDILDTSGGAFYLSYASSCGSLSSVTNTRIIGPGGGDKDFLIPSGNCVGFEAYGTSITTGTSYMTFSK